MENSIKAYQGKSFCVTLQSMIGSTNYGWCLTSLPSCFVLAGQVNNPTAPGIAPVNQVFYFLTVGEPEVGQSANLCFGLYNLSHVSYPFEPEEMVEIAVQVIPCDGAVGSPFVKYSENTAFYNGPDSNLCADLMYGYPCSASANLKYGYPGCGGEGNPVVKYGYPGCEPTPVLKYGYPCAVNNVNLKYGYPCVVNANYKYGYPGCFKDEKIVVKYGYPCEVVAAFKYGYPGCAGED